MSFLFSLLLHLYTLKSLILFATFYSRRHDYLRTHTGRLIRCNRSTIRMEWDTETRILGVGRTAFWTGVLALDFDFDFDFDMVVISATTLSFISAFLFALCSWDFCFRAAHLDRQDALLYGSGALVGFDQHLSVSFFCTRSIHICARLDERPVPSIIFSFIRSHASLLRMCCSFGQPTGLRPISSKLFGPRAACLAPQSKYRVL